MMLQKSLITLVNHLVYIIPIIFIISYDYKAIIKYDRKKIDKRSHLFSFAYIAKFRMKNDNDNL